MQIKIFKTLPKDAVTTRIAVFIEEQKFKEEFDELDQISTHIIMYDKNLPVAVCRYYFNEKQQAYSIGRIAVVKDYRKMGLGAEIIRYAEELIRKEGGQHVCLMSQINAKEFYKKQGYSEYGEIVYDEHCPHIWMKKILKGN